MAGIISAPQAKPATTNLLIKLSTALESTGHTLLYGIPGAPWLQKSHMSKKFVRREQNIRFRSGSFLPRSVGTLVAAEAKLHRRRASIGRSSARLEAASRSLPNPTILYTELGSPVALIAPGSAEDCTLPLDPGETIGWFSP
jgi:hypothetical protein